MPAPISVWGGLFIASAAKRAHPELVEGWSAALRQAQRERDGMSRRFDRLSVSALVMPFWLITETLE
jgi:hypothetical protein